MMQLTTIITEASNGNSSWDQKLAAFIIVC